MLFLHSTDVNNVLFRNKKKHAFTKIKKTEKFLVLVRENVSLFLRSFHFIDTTTLYLFYSFLRRSCFPTLR
jgi:hypothetical protein